MLKIIIEQRFQVVVRIRDILLALLKVTRHLDVTRFLDQQCTTYAPFNSSFVTFTAHPAIHDLTGSKPTSTSGGTVDSSGAANAGGGGVGSGGSGSGGGQASGGSSAAAPPADSSPAPQSGGPSAASASSSTTAALATAASSNTGGSSLSSNTISAGQSGTSQPSGSSGALIQQSSPAGAGQDGGAGHGHHLANDPLW